MSIITGLSIGQKICDVLGLDSKKTKSIQIDIEADSTVLVHVVQYLQEEEFGGITEILKEYKLEPK